MGESRITPPCCWCFFPIVWWHHLIVPSRRWRRLPQFFCDCEIVRRVFCHLVGICSIWQDQDNISSVLSKAKLKQEMSPLFEETPSSICPICSQVSQACWTAGNLSSSRQTLHLGQYFHCNYKPRSGPSTATSPNPFGTRGCQKWSWIPNVPVCHPRRRSLAAQVIIIILHLHLHHHHHQ